MDPMTMQAIGVGANLLGGMMGGNAAGDAASATRAAAERAAAMAQFKPYAVTSGFGTSAFDTENQTATYTLDPRLAEYRDQLYGLNAEAMGNLNLDTTQVAQDYYNQQQGLMAGGRAQEDIGLRQAQLAGGRIGLGLSGAALGAGAGTGYVNPEQYQRDLARANVDSQTAARADLIARQQLDEDIARATGLFSVGAGVERLGYDTMDTGANYGKVSAAAGANAGDLLYQGASSGAKYDLAGDLNRAQMLQGVGEGIYKQDFSSMWTR